MQHDARGKPVAGKTCSTCRTKHAPARGRDRLSECDLFELGDVDAPFGGVVLPNAKLGLQDLGHPERRMAAMSIVLPTFYTGDPPTVQRRLYFSTGRAIDPARHFIVSPNHASAMACPRRRATRRRLSGRAAFSEGITPLRQRRLPTSAADREVGRRAHRPGRRAGRWPAASPISGQPSIRTWSMPSCRSAPRPSTSPHNFVFLDGVRVGVAGGL